MQWLHWLLHGGGTTVVEHTVIISIDAHTLTHTHIYIYIWTCRLVAVQSAVDTVKRIWTEIEYESQDPIGMALIAGKEFVLSTDNIAVLQRLKAEVS